MLKLINSIFELWEKKEIEVRVLSTIDRDSILDFLKNRGELIFQKKDNLLNEEKSEKTSIEQTDDETDDKQEWEEYDNSCPYCDVNEGCNANYNLDM